MKKHTDIYAWLLIIYLGFIPVINVLFFHLGVPLDAVLLLLISCVITITLAYLDIRNLKKGYPDRVVFSIAYILIVPLYLYRRGRFTDSGQKMLGTWIVVLILGFVFEYYYGNIATSLPACHAAETKGVIKSMFVKADYTVVEIKNLKEEGFNQESEVRICSGNVVTEETGVKPILIKVSWINKAKGIFQVSPI